ncbi:hypothetical protein LCGC14_2072610 [marine sediment metagenome]|uniref:Uncharacterized protein n=1 Tax=marine sediment metagenome TaxID=412755 RepID=A0A0F9EI52_9ZZZZ
MNRPYLDKDIQIKAEGAKDAVIKKLGDDNFFMSRFLPAASQPFVFVSVCEVSTKVPLHKNEICKNDDDQLKKVLAERLIRSLRDIKLEINKKIKLLGLIK